MEYIEHGDLSQYIRNYPAKAKAEAKAIILQILEGLEVLHERGICHRDLKPQNVLIASASPIWVKITDFGVSKHAAGKSMQTNCGTFFHRAPEQQGLLPKYLTTRNNYTIAVDLWALGVVAHEVLTTEIPFLESFPVESLQKHGAGAEGIDSVKSLMAVDPAKRPVAKEALKSPWLMGADLSGINSGEPTPPKTTPPKLDDPPTTKPAPPTGSRLLRSQFQHLGVSLSDETADQLFTREDRDEISDTLHSLGDQNIWARTAVSMGYVEVPRVLLRIIDFIDGMDEGMSMLQLAARENQVAVMRLLLNRGANANTPPSIHGRTALQVAAERGHVEGMKLLIDGGLTSLRHSPTMQRRLCRQLQRAGTSRR
ncbi:hypothetical protein Q9L58_010180 [Maublancomyces gigas]|uniref:Protein kinase domain-containing protein n=1 Tax=Discina gigas TaxID=1032678 RepID=A0ABR3G599_9PEZI